MQQEPNVLLLFGICFVGACGLIGLLWLNHKWVTRRTPKSTAAHQTPAAAEHSATGQTIPPSSNLSEAPMGLRAWLDYANKQPDRVPHLAIIGPSGAGKTTLATAVLHDREGQIVVVTAKEGDSWAGLPYVGIDDDASYRTAAATMDRLLTEVKMRLVASKQKQPVGDVLTIVVDDFSTLKNECPAAPELVKLVARLGRSLRVRLVMLSDSALVKAIGLEGEGETRTNFAFVRLARGHKGTIEIDGAEHPLDTSAVSHLASQASLAARAWQAPHDRSEEPSDYLGLSAHNRPFLGVSDQTRPDQTRQTEPSERILMRKYHNAGLTREQARSLLKADGFGFDNNAWAEIGKQKSALTDSA